jgi:hypothetical protein
MIVPRFSCRNSYRLLSKDVSYLDKAVILNRSNKLFGPVESLSQTIRSFASESGRVQYFLAISLKVLSMGIEAVLERARELRSSR